MPAETSRYLARRAEAERSALAARLIVLVAPDQTPRQEPPVRVVQEPRKTAWKTLALAFGAGLAAAWLIRRRRK